MSVAAISKSSFVSAYADTGDTTRFGPTAQAAAHLFTGGNTGDLLTRDPTTSTGAAWSPSIPPAQGGTGITSFTIGDLLYASSATVLAKLAAALTGTVLASGGVGVAPGWSSNPTLTALTLTTSLTVNDVFNNGSTGYRAANAAFFYWSTRAAMTSPADGQINLTNNATSAGVGLDLLTDGTLKIRTRAQTGDAQLSAASVRGNVVAFASLPGTPVEGMCVAVSDSNTAVWGAAIAGGGANHVLAYYNGTAWTVAGK